MLPGEYRGAQDYCQPGAISPDSYASHHELDAVAGVELLHDARDVGLRGQRRQEEALRDLVVGESLTDEPQHLGLALRERGEAARVGGIPHTQGRALEKASRHTGGEQRVAVGDDADRADEVDGLGVLHEEPARACADRARDVLVQLEGRDDHDADAGERGICGDLLGRPQAVAVGHADVQERDIDRGLAQGAQQRFATGRLDDDLDVGLRVQQRAETGAHQLVVVGQRDADHDAPAHGRRATTIVPARGAGVRDRSPPASSARSRIPWIPAPSTASGPSPVPSSCTVTTSSSSRSPAMRSRVIVAVEPPEWRTTFVSASCAMRYAVVCTALEGSVPPRRSSSVTSRPRPVR